MPSARALGILALFCAACAGEARPPSVLLITLDTTRADHIGCYGRVDAGTPNIDALAARGLFFERALSPTPVTLPAHTSLMTASPPAYHGVRDNGLFVVDERLETLAERFAGEGYRTGAFISAFPLESQFGLDQGFELYNERSADLSLAKDMHDRRGDETVAKALAWLGNLEPSEPFFLWVHLFDPHFPYEPPAPFDERFAQDPYQGEIAFADAEIGRLLAAIDPRETLVAVTADHGEDLGDHGEVTHGHLLYDGTQHVPMVLAGPGVPEVGAVGGTVGLVDLAPTLLELAGLDPLGFEAHGGRSLVPDLAAGRISDVPVYLESIFPRLHEGWSELYGVESNGWKYVVASGAVAEDGGPAAELFEVARGESENLVVREPERARSLADLLSKLRVSLAPAEPFDSRPGLAVAVDGVDALGALEALGYAGFDAEASASDAPGLDPRRVIRASLAGSSLSAYLGRGDFNAARAQLEIIRSLDPDGILAADGQGSLAAAEGDFTAAIAAFTRAASLAPGRRGLWVKRAEAEYAAGDRAAARASCQRALDLAPPTPRIQALWARINAP